MRHDDNTTKIDYSLSNINLNSCTAVIDIDLFNRDILNLGITFIDSNVVGFTVFWLNSNYLSERLKIGKVLK